MDFSSLSSKQQAVIIALKRKPLTTGQLATEIGVGRGISPMMQALSDRGLIRVTSKKGGPSSIEWALTEAGEAAYRQLRS